MPGRPEYPALNGPFKREPWTESFLVFDAFLLESQVPSKSSSRSLRSLTNPDSISI
jgi:hypothetical protein